jgi:hypothetical protein
LAVSRENANIGDIGHIGNIGNMANMANIANIGSTWGKTPTCGNIGANIGFFFEIAKLHSKTHFVN